MGNLNLQELAMTVLIMTFVVLAFLGVTNCVRKQYILNHCLNTVPAPEFCSEHIKNS